MSKFKTEVLVFEDLTKQEQEEYSHAEYDSFLKVSHNGKVILFKRDGMEPEDVKFYRDLGWVPDIIEQAYQLGKEDSERPNQLNKEIIETIAAGLSEAATHEQTWAARDLVEQIAKELR